MNVKRYEEIIVQMRNTMAANQNKITDYNEGSVIMTLFESIARIAEQLYIDCRSGYDSELKAIAYSLFDFQKKEGSIATVKVKFTRNEAINRESYILPNTKISDGVHIFQTTQPAIIPVNEVESNEVTASAIDVGTEYNVSANSIKIIESVVSPEIVEVTNRNAATGGIDGETDNEMIERFKNYINGLQGTNTYGIKAGLLKIQGIRSVGIEEHFPPKDNYYNTTVYIDDGTGNRITEEMRNKVIDAINGDDNSVNPGLRAAGINIEVDSCAVVNVSVKVKCTCYRASESLAKAEIEEALRKEINKLKINEDVILTNLILKLRNISYVRDVPSIQISTGEEYKAENIAIGLNQVARFNVSEIEVINV